MTCVLTIRPEPGCSATVAAGRAAGLDIEGIPLFEIRPVPWAVPEGDFDGLLVGSPNALRQAGPLVDKFVDKPVYAVGETTAEAAREHGFAVAWTGQAGLQDLVYGLAGRELRLLRLAGRENVPVSAPAGIELETRFVYETIGLPAPQRLAALLSGGALVLLHSAAAARHFVAECGRLAVKRSDIGLAALSPRIAEAAGGGWATLRSAGRPNEDALLALARDMCHNPTRD